MIEQIGNIILIGTSHIAKSDAEKDFKKILSEICEIKPELVCLELDVNRFRKLYEEFKLEELLKKKNLKNNLKIDTNKKSKLKEKSKIPDKTANLKQFKKLVKQVGVFGAIFSFIAGYFQKKVGTKVEIKPGSDMFIIYEIAREHKIPVALIDLEIEKTLKKLSKLNFFQKLKLFGKAIKTTFKKEYRQILNFDLKSVPDEKIVIRMINILKKEFPDLYKILIEDRNKYMTKKIINYMKIHKGYIVVVVGAGHIEGIKKELLEHFQREKIFPKNSISFSYVITPE